MLNAIRIAIVVVVMLAHIDNGSCEKEAMLSMELIGYGFHRELKYIVIFPGQQGEDRPFNIHQTLPAGVYIDKNQLDDLKRNGKVSGFIISTVVCLGMRFSGPLSAFVFFFLLSNS